MMAKTIWLRREDIAAFEDGRIAASSGLARVPKRSYASYNERAAFNDGWDFYTRLHPPVAGQAKTTIAIRS